MQKKLDPFINKSILVLNKRTSVRVAARALFERQVGCIIACDDDGHIVGLLTDRDLTCLVIAFELPDTTPIEDVMASDILSVDQTKDLPTVIQMMEENGIRRIPVIEKMKNGHEKCIGIVTVDDLIALELIDMAQLARIIRSQISIQTHARTTTAINDNAREHVLNRFNKSMAQSMNLTKPVAEKITYRLLKRIVQRLPYANAANFISQLPSTLQESLLTLHAGPDVNIDEHVILADLTHEFQILHHEAMVVTRKFWQGLKGNLDAHVLDQVLNHLPQSVRALFTGGAWKDEVAALENFGNE